MHLLLTLAAGLFGTAVAVPRPHAQLMKHEVRDEKAAAAVADGLYARGEKWGQAKMTMSDDCPAPSMVVSTTTVDVTVTVTEPCPEETTTSTPCPEESETATSTPCPEPTTPCPDEMSWSMNATTPATAGTSSEPCETTDMPTMTTTTGVPSQQWNTTTPCETETTPPTTTEPCPEPTTPCPDEVTSAPPAAQTTDCIIDLSMTPVSKATLSSTPTASSTSPPSKTVCAHDGHTGSPSADAQYCGVKGLPVGDYFIAEFVEDRPGVPVTEEGCYQFCDSVMQDTRGCQSYRFFTNELGAPRCDLYGMPVSRSLKDLDNKQSGAWYDLGCGSPAAQKWHVDGSMPSNHNATTMH